MRPASKNIPGFLRGIDFREMPVLLTGSINVKGVPVLETSYSAFREQVGYLSSSCLSSKSSFNSTINSLISLNCR